MKETQHRNNNIFPHKKNLTDKSTSMFVQFLWGRHEYSLILSNLIIVINMYSIQSENKTRIDKLIKFLLLHSQTIHLITDQGHL